MPIINLFCTALVTAAEEKETAIDDTNSVDEIHKIQNASSLCCIYLLSSSTLVLADAIDILCTPFFMFGIVSNHQNNEPSG